MGLDSSLQKYSVVLACPATASMAVIVSGTVVKPLVTHTYRYKVHVLSIKRL